MCVRVRAAGIYPTTDEERLSILEGRRGLVPPGLHVMGGPLGLAKAARHVLLEVPRSLAGGTHTLRN